MHVGPVAPTPQDRAVAQSPRRQAQAPPAHSALAVQAAPKGSSAWHAPPASKYPAPQARPQVPAAQVAVPWGSVGQARPHPPQLLGSSWKAVAGSTQAPAQATVGAGQW